MESDTAVKCAVLVCNVLHLKREILCVSGSDYDIIRKTTGSYPGRQMWNEIVEVKATEILNGAPLTEPMKEEIKKFVIPIGMRMLTWAVYHERIIGFSRDFSIDVLEPSFVIQEGVEANKTFVKELLEKERILNNEEKYILACLYCLEDSIPKLYEKMCAKEQKNVGQARSALTKFWIAERSGAANQLRGGKTMDEYRLEKAVESGSIAAVEHCWSLIKVSESPLKGEYIKNAAVHAMRNSVRRRHGIDWDLFRSGRYRDDSWVPKAYYIDILCFLLSQMNEDQKREFLEKDAKTDYREVSSECSKRSRVLAYLLRWPYQVHFMRTARLMWKFLSENNYATLLLKICDKIGLRSRRNMQRGKEETFDYRDLLLQFWKESPERYKRYVFSNERVTYVAGELITVKSGTGLLTSLLTLECFNVRDKEAIRLILAEATATEKEDIILDEDLADTCVELAKEGKCGRLDALRHCFASVEEENKFKSEFFRDWRGQRVFSDSLESDKWNAFLSFAEWCALPEEKLKEFKKELIKSTPVVFAFKDFVLKKREMKLANKILMWCFSTEDLYEKEIEKYKNDLIFSHVREIDYKYFLSEDERNALDDFIKWGISSKSDISSLKKLITNERACSICRDLLYKSYPENYTNVEGGRCKRINKFLKWRYSPPSPKGDYKSVVVKNLTLEIATYFIKSSRYGELGMFFDWLSLPAEEITGCKRRVLGNYVDSMMYRAEMCDKVCVAMGNAASDERRSGISFRGGFEMVKDEAERLVKFILTDLNEVNRFKNAFGAGHGIQDMSPLQKDFSENFCRVLDEYLGFLQECSKFKKSQKTAVKKKFRTFSR